MKRAELSLIWKHSQIYGLANLLSRLAGLVLLPVYLHVLSPAEFGVLALVTLATDVLGVVLGMGLGRALLRYYVGAATDAERDSLIASALALLLVLGVGFTALALPAAQLSCWLIFPDQEHVAVFAYANLAVVFTVLFNFELSCLVARKASVIYLWASLAKAVIMLAANVMLVVHAELGVLGVVLGNLLSSVLLSGLLLLEMVRGRRLRLSREATRKLLAFALPLIPSVLIDTVIAALDKLSVNRLDSTSAVGDYSTGQRLSGLLQMFIVQPFMQIWVVRRLEALDRESVDDGSGLSRIFALFLIALCAAALFVSLFSVEIISMIASAEYLNAARVIPVLALGQVVLALRSYFEVGVFQAQATRHLPWVAFVTLVLAVPTYAVLVRWFGIDGAAVAFLLVAVTRVGLVALVAHRVSSISRDLPWGACLAAVGVAALAYATSIAALPEAGSLGSSALKLCVVLTYVVLMCSTPAVGVDGRRAMLDFALRRRSPKGGGDSSRPDAGPSN